MESKEKLTDILFPHRCSLCGEIQNRGHSFAGICLACYREIRKEAEFFCNGKKEYKKFCLCCGMLLISEDSICSSCKIKKTELDHHFSLFSYRGTVRELIFQYKFKKKARLASILAYFFYKTIKSNYTDYLYQTVPTRKNKSFQHMEEIGKILSRVYRIPLSRFLFRKGGKEQKSLNLQERLESIKGKYGVKQDILQKAKKKTPILLIDDVYTTGATLSECAELLKNQGFKTVRAITFARD